MYLFVPTSGLLLEATDSGRSIQLESDDGVLLLEDTGDLLLEDIATDVLLLENGDILLLEDSDDEGLITIIDETPVAAAYTSQQLYGDMANMMYVTLRLFANAHFGPDGSSDFAGPAFFEILEGPGSFEIRTPE